MQLRLTHLIPFFFSGLIILFSSCGKQFSKDEPLPEEFNPTVIIGSQNGFVYALDPQTSAKIWEFQAGANVQACPVVLGDFVYVAAENGDLHRLDAKRGTKLKTFSIGSQILSTPFGEEKGHHDSTWLFFGAADNKLHAFNMTGDVERWAFPTGGQIISSPVAYDTLLIFASYDGNVYAVRRDSGFLSWTFSAGANAKFYSSPTVLPYNMTDTSLGYVYIGGQDGNMYCLNVNDGTLKYKYTTGGPIRSSPIVHGGNVIFGSNDYKLYCIDVASGLQRWVIPTDDQIVSSPYALNNFLYVGSYDYNMYCVNILQGKVEWKFKTGAIIKSSPMIYDNKLYFGSHDKYLYCLDPITGDLRWKQNINGIIEDSPVVDNMDGKPTNTSSISGNSPE
jgi:eukaryotic-like serine/threonine-protein kinase